MDLAETRDLSKLEARLGLKFKNQALLDHAMIHSSYAHEIHQPDGHNERLEFLGDAVLQLAMGHALYTALPQAREGDLTVHRVALVRDTNLARVAGKLGLEHYLRKSAGTVITSSMLANAMEALVGAIFLDHGWEAASQFVKDNVMDDAPIALAALKSPKAALQELLQKRGEPPPRYERTQSGPAHLPEMVTVVFRGDERLGTGKGSSNREADIRAAENALEYLQRQPRP